MSHAAPAAADRSTSLSVYIAIPRDADADQFWLVQDGVGDGAKFAFTEIHPTLNPFAEQRIRLFVERLVSRELAEAVEEARGSLINAGYPGLAARG